MDDLETIVQRLPPIIREIITDSFLPACSQLQSAIETKQSSDSLQTLLAVLRQVYTSAWDKYIAQGSRNSEAAHTLVRKFSDISQVFDGVKLAVDYAQDSKLENNELALAQFSLGVQYLMSRLPKE